MRVRPVLWSYEYVDKYDDASGNYTQTVSIDGTVVSTLSTASGKAQGWGTAVECQDECSGIVNAHSKLSLAFCACRDPC